MEFKSKHFLPVILSGVLCALAFSVLSLGWLTWFAMIPYFFVLLKYEFKPLKGFFLSLTFAMIFYLGALFWIFQLHPLTWFGYTYMQSLFIITLGWTVFSLVEAIGLSLAGVFTPAFKPESWQRVMLIIALWIVVEWLQGIGGWGFTWGRLANTQFQYLYLIQSLNLFGSMFLSALILFVNLALAMVLVKGLKPSLKSYLVPAAVLFILNLGYGFYILTTKEDTGKPVRAAVIQGNIDSAEKWKPGRLEMIINTYLNLSYRAVAEKPELIVWPESAVPVVILDPRNEIILNEYKRLASVSNAHFISGTFDQQDNRNYNSIVSISPDGKILGMYYKRHLVPFGEYTPFKAILEKIAPSLLSINQRSETTPGTETAVIETPYGRIGGLICFESIIPSIIRKTVMDNSDILILVTNDSWFKDSIGVYQHNAQSVLRAVESDRYLVRAANTGISSVISPTGKIIDSIPPLQEGYLIADVKPRNTMTFYTRAGDLIVLLAAMALLILFILFWQKPGKNYQL